MDAVVEVLDEIQNVAEGFGEATLRGVLFFLIVDLLKNSSKDKQLFRLQVKKVLVL